MSLYGFKDRSTAVALRMYGERLRSNVKHLGYGSQLMDDTQMGKVTIEMTARSGDQLGSGSVKVYDIDETGLSKPAKGADGNDLVIVAFNPFSSTIAVDQIVIMDRFRNKFIITSEDCPPETP